MKMQGKLIGGPHDGEYILTESATFQFLMDASVYIMREPTEYFKDAIGKQIYLFDYYKDAE